MAERRKVISIRNLISRTNTLRPKSAILLLSPVLPLVFLFGFSFFKQAWYSHRIVDKNLGQWESSMSDTSAFAMQAMNKLIEENPQATNFRVRWGFSNAGQNSDYYEVYYLYHKNEKHFIYKDSWGQKEQTVLSYDNVEPSMIRDIASQRDATAKELRWSKNISERRVLEDIQ